MPNAEFDKGIEGILNDGIALSTDTIKATLIHSASLANLVTGATNAGPIVITSAIHGLSTNDRVVIGGVLGNTNANGVWVVTNLTTNTFSLNGSTGNGAYTSGGYIVKLSGWQYLGDIASGARVATSNSIGSKTFTLGTFDGADALIPAVTGLSIDSYVIHKDTGSAATSPLLAWVDRTPAGAALGVTPNGGDITIVFDTAGIFRIQTPTGQGL